MCERLIGRCSYDQDEGVAEQLPVHGFGNPGEWAMWEWLRVDISISAVVVGEHCFSYTYSLQSTSRIDLIGRYADGGVLEQSIREFSAKAMVLGNVKEDGSMVVENEYNPVTVSSFLLKDSRRIRRIVIGEESLLRVSTFEISGLSELESVVIGNNSLVSDKPKEENANSTFKMANCGKLRSLKICDNAFFMYGSMTLTSLPSLQTIDMGESCFKFALSLSITGALGILHSW